MTEIRNEQKAIYCRKSGRIGVRWHNAVNKGVIAALVRADMIVIDMAGDDALYDKLRSYNPKGEADVVKRFSSSAVNAERQHRENMAKIVR